MRCYLLLVFLLGWLGGTVSLGLARAAVDRRPRR